jgi:hypothetical protein
MWTIISRLFCIFIATKDGSISVARGISAESLTASTASVTVLETTSIASPSGVVRVSGQIATG